MLVDSIENVGIFKGLKFEDVTTLPSSPVTGQAVNLTTGNVGIYVYDGTMWNRYSQ